MFIKKFLFFIVVLCNVYILPERCNTLISEVHCSRLTYVVFVVVDIMYVCNA